MKVILDSTQTVIEIVVDGRVVPARVWEGHTEEGTPVVAWITRVSPQTHDPDVAATFGRELHETARPSLAMPAGPIPLRFIL